MKLGRLGGLRPNGFEARGGPSGGAMDASGDVAGSGGGIEGGGVELPAPGTVRGWLGCAAGAPPDPPALGRESRCGGTGLTALHPTTEHVLHDVLTTRGRSVIAAVASRNYASR
jgi:hypothetical protein